MARPRADELEPWRRVIRATLAAIVAAGLFIAITARASSTEPLTPPRPTCHAPCVIHLPSGELHPSLIIPLTPPTMPATDR